LLYLEQLYQPAKHNYYWLTMSESNYAPTNQGGQVYNDRYASKLDLENFATLFLLIIMNFIINNNNIIWM
jgi:hypothetical protein